MVGGKGGLREDCTVYGGVSRRYYGRFREALLVCVLGEIIKYLLFSI